MSTSHSHRTRTHSRTRTIDCTSSRTTTSAHPWAWRVMCASAGLFGLLYVPPAVAAGPDSKAIQGQYQIDRRACLDGRSGQAMDSCLKEAGAVRYEALHAKPEAAVDTATLKANALARCAAQLPAQRADCELLARGQGMESGSVSGGGVIKEVVTRTVGSAPASAPAAAAVAASAAPAKTR